MNGILVAITVEQKRPQLGSIFSHPSSLRIQCLDGDAGALLVLLACSAPHAACSLDDAIASDWHRALTGDHVSTFGAYDALNDGSVPPFG